MNIISLFEDQVIKVPHHTAIFYDNAVITYEELDIKINKLVSFIRNEYQKTNQPICFCLDRGFDMIAVILAILKMGCFYVPLDKKYPLERIKYILNDIQPELIITDQVDLFTEYNTIDLSIGIDYLDRTTSHHMSDSISSELAYVIYTSGTTGKPKGVMIKQSSLINLIMGSIRYLSISDSIRILQYASIGFDAAGWDIYLALLSGSSLYMVSDEMMLSPVECHHFILKHTLNMVTVTPAFLSQFPLVIVPSLSILVVMGDLADAKNMEFWCKSTTVYNGYGPTETTIGATIHHFTTGDNPRNIGKPFENYEIYLLDEEMNISDVGEIYIGGLGVSSGYWNNIHLTSQKFITGKYGKLYQTGDLAKLDQNGDLEFIGRKDNQIKINGVRIELEEIENLVMTVFDIKRACVHYNGNDIIVYYTSKKEINSNLIKSHLRHYLHPAVVPVFYVWMKEFVLTRNGKVDKKMLPQIQVSCQESIVKPKNQFEDEILSIYKESLDNDEIGMNSNFFEIGGDSLKAYKVSSKISSYGYSIKPIDILKYTLISDICLFLLDQKPDIKDLKIDLKESYHLSPLQTGIWYYQLMHPDDTSYNMPIVLSIDKKVNLSKLFYCLRKIIERHPVLRTKIYLDNDLPFQKFDPLEYQEELHKLSYHDILSDIEREIKIPFNMFDWLIRIKMYEDITHHRYILFISKHNIIVDAYSEALIARDLEMLYHHDCDMTIDNPKINYGIYADYLYEIFTRDVNSKKYWQNKLLNYVPSTIPKTKSLTGGVLTKKIPLLPNLQQLAITNNVTLYTLLLSSYSILMYRYCQNVDISVGSQIVMRNDPRWNDLVGFMVSTTIIRNTVDVNLRFSNFMNQVTNSIYEAMDHQFITYDELLKYCQHQPESMFVYQNNDSMIPQFDQIEINKIDIKLESNAFPLYWNLYPDSKDLVIKLSYISGYEHELIEDMLNSYEIILKSIMNNCDQKISEIQYLVDQESCLLPDTDAGQCKPRIYTQPIHGDLIDWDHLSIDKCFTNNANLYPDREILYYSSKDKKYLSKAVTYGKINDISNKIAFTLINNYHINKDDIVGVSMRRSKDFVYILMAILRIGATYVPLDPDYPEDRLSYMISDCNPKIVISRNDHIPNCLLVKYDDIRKLEPKHDILDINLATPETLAYIIYTSGSTGKPKACMIKHQSVMNVLFYFQDKLKIESNDKLWSLTSVSFDIMVLEIFLPLVAGCKLLICPQCISMDPVLLVEWINYEKPTIIQATPTQYSLIANHFEPFNPKLLVGGEKITNKLLQSLLRITNKIYNVYGPTETTIWSTCGKLKADKINIGRPIANTYCVVLDNQNQIVPRGCIGELYIGGDGVSKGYLNREKLTGERFILYNGKTYYKTGDLVRINWKGKIEYIGRNDFQIKIRGHRVELEEIVNVIESYDSINRAVVIPITHEAQIYIVGYFTSKIIIDNSELHEYLRTKLPHFMVPNYLIQLPRFPETLNGKIDNNKLPNPFDPHTQITYVHCTHKYTAPRNETEFQIHEICKQMTGFDKISIHDSFLNIGVTSIMFPGFIAKIEQVFGVKISIANFIQNSTIERCSIFVEEELKKIMV